MNIVNSMYRDCIFCNKSFKTTLYKVSIGKGKFCSQKCYWESSKRRIPYNKKTIYKKCLICRKSFGVSPSHDYRKYCSVKCHGKSMVGHIPWNKNKKYTEEETRKLNLQGLYMGRQWKDKKLREKITKAILKGMKNRPTSLERQMIGIIQKYNLPYKYVGDGSFLIGFKNPDFININGEKKLIEVGNTFHHQGNYIEERKAHFTEYGWESHFFIGDKLDEKEVLKNL